MLELDSKILLIVRPKVYENNNIKISPGRALRFELKLAMMNIFK